MTRKARNPGRKNRPGFFETPIIESSASRQRLRLRKIRTKTSFLHSHIPLPSPSCTLHDGCAFFKTKARCAVFGRLPDRRFIISLPCANGNILLFLRTEAFFWQE